MMQTKSPYSNFIKQRDTDQTRRFLTSVQPQGAGCLVHDGHEYINFSSNDYLGLSQHPVLIERSKQWGTKYGVGAGASRLVTGNIEPFLDVEKKVAAFKKKPAALIMVSGYQANASVLPAIFDAKVLGQEPLVFSDKLVHASMHAGCAAAGVKQIRFRHNDVEHLQDLLEKYSKSQQPKFILIESVYSMDGDIAPIDEIAQLSREHNCFLICDEAHATGVLGERGSGLGGQADLIIGTFSKAFGAFGAYVACTEEIKDYLVNRCAGLIYATALPPNVLGAIDAGLDLVPQMQEDRNHLRDISDYFRHEINKLGFDCGNSQTQIVPLMVGAADEALYFSEVLKAEGFWASAIREPTVPKNSARIRFAFSAKHQKSDVKRLVQTLSTFVAMKEVG